MLRSSGFLVGLAGVPMLVLSLAIAPPAAAEGTRGEMYFLFCFEGCSIARANLDGSNLSIIGETALPGLGIDLVNRKLYFSDFLFGVELPTVNRSDLDGSNEELIDTVDEITDQPTGYAVDTLNGKVYWGVSTDVNQGILKRANLNGSDVEIVVAETNPYRIAVDPFGQKIYWTDWEVGNNKIQRADLDGSNIEILVTAEDPEPDTFFQPASIAVDHRNGKMYWTDTGHPEDRIQRSNLDGSDVETLLRDEDLPDGGFPRHVALDLNEEKIYFSDVGGGGFILRANLDGSSVETLIAFGTEFGGPGDIVLDPFGDVPATSPWAVVVLIALLLATTTAVLWARRYPWA